MTQYSIIGGGIAGASIAYHLLKDNLDVTLYDDNQTGQATKQSAGIICPWVSQRRNKKWYRLVKEGAKYYPLFIDELESTAQQPTGFSKNGSVSLFKDEHIQSLAYDRISKKQVDAPEMGDVQKLSYDELASLFPELTKNYPGVYVSGGAQVNGHMLLDALMKAIRNLGGVVKKERANIEALSGTVIYTAGAWHNKQIDTPKVSHQKAELLHFKLNSDSSNQDYPLIMALGPTYIIQTGLDTFAIGTTHIDTDSFDTTPSPESEQQLMNEAKRYFPNHSIEKLHMAVGLRPYTNESLPYIGWVEDNVFVVNGLGSSGLTAAPVIGREVSRYLNDQETTLNLSDYQYEEPLS
ncbi:D-amino acid dehydrogenase small subunit [Pelagirhabdus alkalitolerans]|uniref:D-amino acid dehydrogenase small subunit n=1 Tax=Pelagirhabdus alkalitolerans TaxID=1612202 RepID=A0A1G6H5Q2_9BACI|nr:FAD-dependent oxidoreductase [Pelagirhabdus alkalitolerans]SDB89609.1 D-amino acid dehydrogenase small subunit [Pelagirhabdus alkalitolerans]